MIDTGTALITSSVIGLFGIILIQLISNSNWFKRENFKIQKSNVMAENKIKLKKLERELGVGHTPVKNVPTGNMLDTIKNLDLDKIQDILDLLGQDQSGGGSKLDQLTAFLEGNPAVLNILPAILDKLNLGVKPEESQKYL